MRIIFTVAHVGSPTLSGCQRAREHAVKSPCDDIVV